MNYDSPLLFVKEQRVYGSWVFIILAFAVPAAGQGVKNLRYTLVDFERDYQIKNLSNQLYKTTYGARFFSCLPKTQHSLVEKLKLKTQGLTN